MSRNLVARPILTIGLLSASLAWLGFTLQRTVFDATRTERAAEVLLDERTVRDALLQQLVSTVDAQLPPPLRNQVTSEQLASVAATTLDDPAVRNALLTSIGGTHRYLLGEVETPPSLDQTVVDGVLRQQLAAISPGLAAAAPTLPAFEVPLPTEGLGVVRSVRSFVATATPLAALLALGCIAAALALSPTRPRVLRRVGLWAMTTGALWVALRFLVPAFTKAFLPTGTALVAGLTEALVGSIMGPGVLLAAAGAAIWVGGFVLGRVDLAPAGAGYADPSTASRERARARAERARAAASTRRTRAVADEPRAGATARVPAGGAPVAAGGRDGDRRWGSRRGRAAMSEPSAPVADDAGLYAPPRTAQPPVAAASADASVAPGGARHGVRDHAVPEYEAQEYGAQEYGAGQHAAQGYGATAPASVPRVDTSTPGSGSAGAAVGRPGLGGASFDTRTMPTSGVFAAGGQAGLTAPFAPTTAVPTTSAGGQPLAGGVPLPGGVELPKRARTGPVPAPEPLSGTADLLATHGIGELGAFSAGPGATTVPKDPARDAGQWLGGFSLDPDQHRRVADPAPPPPRWVQGVGYVYDEPPTPNARWVDGLGYVLDDV